MASTQCCGIVIFGASGDLAHRKLVPALYELSRQGLLDERSYVIGFARTHLSDADYRRQCRDSVAAFARRKPLDAQAWSNLEQRIHYFPADYDSPADYDRLARLLAELDAKYRCPGNRLFYLATPPTQFEPIIARLGDLTRAADPLAPVPAARQQNAGWHRLIIEKPFGHDEASARALNQLIHHSFTEADVFRIDHYLGKETVQNLLVLRFANSIFEPIWNYKYIDHVQITVAENIGVESRGGYYDRAGALRDMVQNHILQLMALVAMEPPAALDAASIRDEKVKAYRSVRAVRPNLIAQTAIRGQYAGYRAERGVAPDSTTETFAAVKLFIDNWRWSGMPFYLRTGKHLPVKLSEIVVRFRSPPLTLFQKQCEAPVYPNDLVIRVQPDEGISLRLNGKVPGGQMNIKPVALDFLYRTTFQAEPPEAYERLIHDAIMGDQTLFIRADEAEAAWAVVDPIQKAWTQAQTPPQDYAPGTWGPAKAHELIELDGRRWLHSGQEAEPIIACSL